MEAISESVSVSVEGFIFMVRVRELSDWVPTMLRSGDESTGDDSSNSVVVLEDESDNENELDMEGEVDGFRDDSRYLAIRQFSFNTFPDCGSASNYTQDDTRIYYVSDDGFIEGGDRHDLSNNYSTRVYNTIRSFPKNEWNCYTLRPKKGKNNRYLIRAIFYGKSRGQTPQFDLYFGADYWVTVNITDTSKYVAYEMIHLTSSDYINVCLVNTDEGDPFITSLELRLLENTMYDEQSPSTLILEQRTNFVTKTSKSILLPILNALEIYTLKQFQQNQTDDQYAAAMWSIKSTYGGLTTLNWQGDPCVPQPWVGLICNYNAQGAAKIISLNLSSRGLSGEIAPALADLTMIESLDLSYNNLTGRVPEIFARLDNLGILNLVGNNFTRTFPAQLLAKSKDGLLWLTFDTNVSAIISTKENRNNKPNLVDILAPIIGFVVVLSLVVLLVKQLKQKAFIRMQEGFTLRKQQFTYSEVLCITKKIHNEIGRGGFGSVFHGNVGGNQVAVKMLSESASQGYREFQAEVKLLMEIHHTNTTSLVGYCDDNKHKGIIYEFMANGNLENHLFDGCPNVLSWERRLQIGFDAAEGLAYMHHGCRPPIVHRDVKCSNILLNESFQAKVSDFGLSRAYPTEDATHVSSLKVAGTVGYLDPEYHSTNRLTEKSDVYSFGVVLLELITGRRAILDGINVINWVKSSIEEGNVETIIDARLEGRFDINTAWTVVETAIACVSPTSIKRPTMNDVVMDLKHCVQAEKTRQTGSVSFNLESVSDPNPR
ncbi:hypothetical protein L1987_53801 [Smallanthus sonchifolius]|uniref:Uncharacterized protein n=1 Tax=Smallanthus sonchifolius TaxID=185202 RepID=A0ACB9EY57_9ASTR|nr:hypothetical protein L1987_53801 [Smallanthus sonchifolius]